MFRQSVTFIVTDCFLLCGLVWALEYIDKESGIIYNTNMKIIIDTNVLVSGLQSTKGYSNKLLNLLPDDRFTIAVSVPLILEYEAQLKKHLPKDVYTDEDIDNIINFICKISRETKIYYLWRPYLRDPYDDHILELAIASGSEYIVTFNKKDFTNLDEYGIQIVSPKEFVSVLEGR